MTTTIDPRILLHFLHIGECPSHMWEVLLARRCLATPDISDFHDFSSSGAVSGLNISDLCVILTL